jgi:putative tricarboxylic transport membrane protein
LRLQWGSLKSTTLADVISRGDATGLTDTMKIRAPKDFWSGVMFCGFAAVAIFAARGYSLGSAGRMGPGYFPLLLAGLLAVLGAALIARSVVLSGEPLSRFHVQPLVLIAAGVCLFGVLIEPSGLVVSLAVLTLMAALSGGRFRLVETLALAAALIVFSVGVFVYALGLPLNIWPSL